MKLFIASALVMASVSAFAAPKTYQVTGPVLEVNDSSFVVQKGKEKWEVQKDAGTKVTGELKVGSKVSVSYVMVAKDVEAKEDKKALKK